MDHLADIFRIIEGALRSDAQKVRSYSELLADKLREEGDAAAARRLKRLLDQQSRQLRPTELDTVSIPVDGESRFPLLSIEPTTNDVDKFIFTDVVRSAFDEFISAIRNRDLLESKDIQISSSLLLYGPPGCGKTHLARLIAHELRLPLYSARLDGVVSSYLGSTAKNIRAILEFGARRPCIVFLDEFDAIAKLRDDQHEIGELKRVVNSFLQSFDQLGHDSILIAATNHESLLDSAVWRRFQYQIHLGPPDVSARKHLWALFSRDIEWSDGQLAALADLSEGYSSAAIESTATRLLQKSVVYDEVPTVREAITLLCNYGPVATPVFPASARWILDDLPELKKFLQERNPHLYTLSLIGELAGRSASTISRTPYPELGGPEWQKTDYR